jgi:hypothetical protein
MACGHINVSNGTDDKKLPIGFSWTVLFFGFFPALFRDDWKGGIVILCLLVFTFGWALLVIPFFYNRYYARMILSNQYKVLSFEGITEAEAKRMLGLREFQFYDVEPEVSRIMELLEEASKNAPGMI